MQAELDGIIDRFGADSGTIHLLADGVLILRAHAGIPRPVAQGATGDVRPGARRTGVNGEIVPIRGDAGGVVGALGNGVRREYEYFAAETARLLDEASRLDRTPQG